MAVNENRPPMRRRPFFLWVVILGLLVFAIFNGLRLYGALHAWSSLQAIGVQPGAWYIAVTGGIFAVAFLAAFLLLLFRSRGAAWTVTGVILAYILWYWLDRLLLTRNPMANMNATFAACASFVLAGFALAAVWTWEKSPQ